MYTFNNGVFTLSVWSAISVVYRSDAIKHVYKRTSRPRLLNISGKTVIDKQKINQPGEYLVCRIAANTTGTNCLFSNWWSGYEPGVVQEDIIADKCQFITSFLSASFALYFAYCDIIFVYYDLSGGIKSYLIPLDHKGRVVYYNSIIFSQTISIRIVLQENPAYIAPICFINFSELALVGADGFMLSDFLKLAVAFFLSPFVK